MILAGGFGKRLRPLTDSVPKPMIQIAGIPILERQIDWLLTHNISEIVICAGYRKDVIVDYFGSGKKFGVSIGYSIEEEPLGTGGALRNASMLINGDRFIVMNGDVLTNLDPWKIIYSCDSTALGSIALVPLRSSFGIVENVDGLARAFREKPILKDYWINAGIYCLSRHIIDHLPSKGNIEDTTFPILAKQNRIHVVNYDDAHWKSIDSHKDVEEATTSLMVKAL